ncbi:MAG: AraC family transcriptional regulator [Polyangiaceae bacterium]
MASRLTGALYTFTSRALYVGPLLESADHRHHAAQIVWAPGGVDLEQERRGMRRSTFHVIEAHHAHRHGAASLAAVLWVDPDELRSRPLRQGAAPSRQLARLLTKACSVLGTSARESEVAVTVAEQLFALAAPHAANQPSKAPGARHPAVLRMRRWLDANAPEDSAHLGELARKSGLSVRQLRHRFTLDAGINPRSYRRWVRLRRAIEAIARGATLTEGAFEGGFADGAHFSRVFRSQFGLSPQAALSGLLSRRA